MILIAVVVIMESVIFALIKALHWIFTLIGFILLGVKFDELRSI
jgi:hypothetical protein